jgi:hypothetical protein
MALINNTTTTYAVGTAGGNREDLEDVIWDLEPLETYCLTSFDKVKATATFHEWPKDALVAPASNIGLEGDDFVAGSITQATRVGNYCQIFRKQFLVSGTQEAVKSAGRASDVVRQRKKQMMELKNDIEYAIVRNQASSVGGAGTGRTLGSIESWIPSTDNTGNGLRATTSASASTAAYSSGVSAPTDGTTTGPVTEAKFKEGFQLAWQAGAKDTVVLVSATQKTAISAFSGNSTKYNDIKSNNRLTIASSADIYVSEYGDHMIKLHRHVRSSVILILDPDYWAIAQLRTPQMLNLAPTGDAEKVSMLAELTLVARNHLASAKVAACA